jgi:hypothetical protein
LRVLGLDILGKKGANLSSLLKRCRKAKPKPLNNVSDGLSDNLETMSCLQHFTAIEKSLISEIA